MSDEPSPMVKMWFSFDSDKIDVASLLIDKTDLHPPALATLTIAVGEDVERQRVAVKGLRFEYLEDEDEL